MLSWTATLYASIFPVGGKGSFHLINNVSSSLEYNCKVFTICGAAMNKNNEFVNVQEIDAHSPVGIDFLK